jgi:hypothetical protein
MERQGEGIESESRAQHGECRSEVEGANKFAADRIFQGDE